MDRRSASKLILGAGLAAPALIRPDSLLANPEKLEGKDNKFEQWSRLVLKLSGRPDIFLSYIIFTSHRNPFNMFAIALRGEYLKRKIGQANLTKIPGLGQLFSEPVVDRYLAYNPVGLMFLADTMLIIEFFGDQLFVPKKTTVVNNDWETQLIQKPNKIKKNPELVQKIQDPKYRKSYGEAVYDKKTGELIAAIPPNFRLKTPRS